MENYSIVDKRKKKKLKIFVCNYYTNFRTRNMPGTANYNFVYIEFQKSEFGVATNSF